MKRIIEIQHGSRRTVHRLIAAAILIVAAEVLTVGCAGVRGSISIGIGGGAKSSEATYQTPSSFDNNSTVRLKEARYTGDLVVGSNRVTIEGQGTATTGIRGDVQIHGNSCTIRDVSVTGDVYLYGSNNNLQNVRIAGQVSSEGNNNSW